MKQRVAIAKKLLRIAKELTWDDIPKLEEFQVEGNPVFKRDRIRLYVTGGHEMVGTGSKYYVKMVNPNRGETGFQLESIDDLKKLVASLESATSKAESKLKEFEKQEKDFFDKLREQAKSKE